MAESTRRQFRRYRAGDLQLDLEQCRVMRDGSDIRLGRLTFELMHRLMISAPALVTKEELAQTVWKGRFVSRETIAQRVKLLRKALNDDAHQPQFVEVVHGQGYRWLPTVVPERFEPNRDSVFVGNPNAAEGLDLEPPARPSLAVLPFDTLGDQQLDHVIFADGLTHDLITSIGRTRWLFVVARGTAFMFRGSGHPAQDIARRLGVRYVLQGSVMFSGRRVRVNAALTDADSGEEIWSEILQGNADDVFAMHDDICAEIVAAIELEVDLAEQKRAAVSYPDSLDAWSAYHRGWWHLNAFVEDSCEQGERFFRQSISLEPDSARAYAGLSTVYWILAFLEATDDRQGDIERAYEYAEKGVALDRRDPLCHFALGRALHLQQEFARSMLEFELSTDLNPNFAFGKFAQAFAMMHVGENKRSNAILRDARRLSPYDPMSYAMLGVQAINHALLGEFDEAAAVSIRGSSLQAWRCQMFPAIAALCHALSGDEATAREYYTRLLEQRPGYGSDDFFRAFPLQRDEDSETVESAFRTLRNLH